MSLQPDYAITSYHGNELPCCYLGCAWISAVPWYGTVSFKITKLGIFFEIWPYLSLFCPRNSSKRQLDFAIVFTQKLWYQLSTPVYGLQLPVTVPEPVGSLTGKALRIILQFCVFQHVSLHAPCWRAESIGNKSEGNFRETCLSSLCETQFHEDRQKHTSVIVVSDSGDEFLFFCILFIFFKVY